MLNGRDFLRPGKMTKKVVKKVLTNKVVNVIVWMTRKVVKMKNIFVMTRKKKRSLYMHEYLRMDFHGCFREQPRGEERCIWGLRTM